MGILIGVFAVLVVGLAIKSKLGNTITAQPLPDDDDDTPTFQTTHLFKRGVCDITSLDDDMSSFDDEWL